MRTILTLLALLGGFILVAMLVAPTQPVLREWYAAHACGYLDQISTDICAGVRRGARGGD